MDQKLYDLMNWTEVEEIVYSESANPHAILGPHLREEGLLDKLTDRIAIGQGMQGRTGRLGVGRCTEKFDTCIMGCPPEPEKIYRELKEYIVKNMQ